MPGRAKGGPGEPRAVRMPRTCRQPEKSGPPCWSGPCAVPPQRGRGPGARRLSRRIMRPRFAASPSSRCPGGAATRSPALPYHPPPPPSLSSRTPRRRSRATGRVRERELPPQAPLLLAPRAGPRPAPGFGPSGRGTLARVPGACRRGRRITAEWRRALRLIARRAACQSRTRGSGAFHQGQALWSLLRSTATAKHRYCEAPLLRSTATAKHRRPALGMGRGSCLGAARLLGPVQASARVFLSLFGAQDARAHCLKPAHITRRQAAQSDPPTAAVLRAGRGPCGWRRHAAPGALRGQQATARKAAVMGRPRGS